MSGSHGRLKASEQDAIIGGKPATVLFVFMLLAFVAESQLTQYVESNLNFEQPYLLFYIAHSTMTIIFPLHLLYLHMFTPFSARSYIRGLSVTVREHLSSKVLPLSGESVSSYPTAKIVAIISWCTLGFTIPSLLWFAAVAFASVSDITAIWNSNAFWAYVISVKLRNLSWEPRRLASVMIASFGVLAVVYGSKNPANAPQAGHPRVPILGNMLTLIASIGYGIYQVAYNMYAVPPSYSEPEQDGWRRVSISSDGTDEIISTDVEPNGLTLSEEVVYPLPFGLYANALTSAMGLLTLLVLWIPLPILHIMSIEPFKWPGDLLTTLSIGGIALTGVIFYATFMILLGVWGPIVTSVGNLLTIVLVMISDLIFGNAIETLTVWSIVGSGMIISAFAVLAYETFRA
ncbi:hypothetical protein M0805_004825 [Coniferiporia weirii]|nr:hypothetical protein M0805_004825 [Coniferiporia weirii]